MIDAQLQKQIVAALSHPEFVRTGKGQVQLSEIFKWY